MGVGRGPCRLSALPLILVTAWCLTRTRSRPGTYTEDRFRSGTAVSARLGAALVRSKPKRVDAV